ncbi:MAG: hypothetical protein P8X91_09485, partial [Candidatus Bathyarchaeota archaeon]
MTLNKIALFAIPVIAAVLIGGSLAPASAGVSCGGDVQHFLHNSRGATAYYENTKINVYFAFGQDNCTPDQGPPEKYGFVSISSFDGCGGYYEIGPNDFVWSLGRASLKLDTNCGEVIVLWQSNSPVEDESYTNMVGNNCHDGKEATIDLSKATFADSILLLNGEIVDETLDPDDAIIFRGTVIQ